MQYFSWWIYVLAGALFTVYAFTGLLYKEGSLVFSEQNAKPLSAVLIVHLEFLLILFGLMWIAPFVYPYLPNWMTDTFNVRGAAVSSVDVLFVLAMGALHLIERRWIYLESEAGGPDAGDEK